MSERVYIRVTLEDISVSRDTEIPYRRITLRPRRNVTTKANKAENTE